MTMRFEYHAYVEVERVSGKFASRDEIGEAVREAMQDAIDELDLSWLGADGDSEYEVVNSTVDEMIGSAERTRRRKTRAEVDAILEADEARADAEATDRRAP